MPIRTQMWRRVCLVFLAAAGWNSLVALVSADEPAASDLAHEYEAEIQPLLRRYCHECHGADLAEADIDLSALDEWEEVSRESQTWQRVAEMLGGSLMPPEDAPQPTEAEKQQIEKWLHKYLALEARSRAGDPGRVVLRRLSNAEYTYTIHDLTGVTSLDPAREFPVDGAAGEGFSNAGSALVMSPALFTKYLDAARDVASHAVLLPSGFRFSSHRTSRDWTEEILQQIRAFYREHSERREGEQVNLQGVVFDTNEGGQLAIAKYLVATLVERDALESKSISVEEAAREYGLNERYFAALWSALTRDQPSVLLGNLQTRWRKARPDDAAAIASEIASWQKTLWRFTTVGHIGKVGGPKRWMEAVSPLKTQQEIRYKISTPPGAKFATISLATADLGDGNEHDFVVWHKPRLVAPGRPDLLLRDVRAVSRQWRVRRDERIDDLPRYLTAADEATTRANVDPGALAAEYELDEDRLRSWLEYLGIGTGDKVELEGHFTDKLNGVAGYDFVSGWGSGSTPSIVANSSDQHVRIPGNMPPQSVAVHPSPTLRAAVGWRSPVSASVRIEGVVTHAHPECGNGVTWSLELRRGGIRRKLAAGTAQGSAGVEVGPIQEVEVRVGDVVSLLVGPRGGDHSCDLTTVDLTILDGADQARTWHLSEDVARDITAANPHADRYGNEGVWHFYAQEDRGGSTDRAIPSGSVLARWQSEHDGTKKRDLALELRQLLKGEAPEDSESPDGSLYRQLTQYGSPMFGKVADHFGDRATDRDADNASSRSVTAGGPADQQVGLDSAMFGTHPNGTAIDPESLCVRAPAVITVRLPVEIAESCEFVVTCSLDASTGAEGSVQVFVEEATPGADSSAPSQFGSAPTEAQHVPSAPTAISPASPILVTDGSVAQARIAQGLATFRDLFPAALCYTQIVPVDEAVTLTLYYREDDHLARLMLDGAQREQLDRLWGELHFVSRDALAQVDALAQLIEYATQDSDPTAFEPLRKSFDERAATFRQQLIDAEPKHLDALIEFAGRAYRRPVTTAEEGALRGLYRRLRQEGMEHDEAFRLTLARVLVSPDFLYRIEKPAPGDGASPISDWELASRLSFFLWSSQPDETLRQLAAAGRLTDPIIIAEQAERMMDDAKVRRLATEFACQWLQIYDFAHFDEKSDRHFPTFAPLRGAMYEEPIQFFTALFQSNGSVLDILDADYAFLNEALAEHYGVPGVTGPEWRRVRGVKAYSRGGILGMGAILARQAGASRTSPILRGTWTSEVLLGEKLPRPPKGVPPLPDDASALEGLTVRQLVEKHVSDPKCAVCHKRIDHYGFALESFDAIGRFRTTDAGGQAIDDRATTMEGVQLEGIDGLRNYLLVDRREAFVRQFCRKMLGYALGRSVQLSDEPLLDEIQARLKASDYQVRSIVEAIVLSRQFREIRGRDAEVDDVAANR